MMMRSYFEHELGDCARNHARSLQGSGRPGSQRLQWRIGWFLVDSLDYTVTRRLALRVP